jgi:hypothetical protein
VRHRGGGGKGVGGRGTGCRRTRRSPAGKHRAEEAGALVGEATGGEVGALADGGVVRGVAGSSARRRGRHRAEEAGA